MSFKITSIGAGSVGFTRTLFTDLMVVPEFHDTEVSFTDLSEHNLEMVRSLCPEIKTHNHIDHEGNPKKIYSIDFTIDLKSNEKSFSFFIE